MFSGSVPLSLSAIQGSAKLNQLIDDAVGLGQSSRDKSLVYVKQCKWRNGELILDSDNVALYERAKNGEGQGIVLAGHEAAGHSQGMRYHPEQSFKASEQLIIHFMQFMQYA